METPHALFDGVNGWIAFFKSSDTTGSRMAKRETRSFFKLLCSLSIPHSLVLIMSVCVPSRSIAVILNLLCLLSEVICDLQIMPKSLALLQDPSSFAVSPHFFYIALWAHKRG
jgi:hypothetical protein